jgi:hypothetical protein
MATSRYTAPPPAAPAPNVSVCANVGRRINVSRRFDATAVIEAAAVGLSYLADGLPPRSDHQ